MVKALTSINTAIIDNMINPKLPYLVRYHMRDAKHVSFSGIRKEGSHVPINIKTIVTQHIVTSYFPRAWKGIDRKDLKAHSSPKTNCMYGTMKSAALC